GARTRMARKPPALARELLRNFPKRRTRGTRRRRKGPQPTEGHTQGASPPSRGAGAKRAGEQGAARSDNGKVPRSGTPRGGGRASKGAAPSDAVLAEALANDDATQAGTPRGHKVDGGLEPGSGEKLRKNVEEALDRADQPTGRSAD
ncbi:MAG TPA: hypothetical protein VNX67_08495, partial [Solirubrobacteraceae bacterium]|nr:hypothetical protein [Solirubrobacteraceae bacterium]